MLQKKLGQRIAALRRTRKLTQEKLAEALGCSVEFISLVERGVKIQLVLSEGDWGQDYLDSILGADSADNPARSGIQCAIVRNCDHLLTPLAAQREVCEPGARWSAEWI